MVRAGESIPQSRSDGDVLILCTGWAFRYHQLADEGRQILRFLLPGDLLWPAVIFAERPNFSVKALTGIQVSRMDGSEIRKKCLADEAVMLEVLKAMTDDGREAYELLTSIGRRSAEARIAHLLLGLKDRIAAHHVSHDHRFPFPLRQQHIADAVGLTPVYVSRVLARFRDRGILTIAEGTLEITDPAALETIGAWT